ncbi:MAG: cupin domain-containing protein, partial [Desulfosarcinaceae bacterium]
MFQSNATVEPKEPLPGVQLKTLVWGSKTMLTQFNIRQGSEIPAHHHPHEQTGYLVSGRMRLSVADKHFEAGPGDSWCIPADVPHGAAA